MTVRVLLADDQPLMLSGIAALIGSSPDIEVVGLAANGTEAIHLSEQLRPDVVCLDVQMPETSGLEAARAITDPTPAPAVIMLTTFAREDYLMEALEAGAQGYLLKNTRPENLIEGVIAAARGDSIIAPELTSTLIRRATASPAIAPSAEESRILDNLTDREREILGHVALGLSNAEIAKKLVLGPATVKTHISNILMKMGLRDRVQAVVWVHTKGVIDLL